MKFWRTPLDIGEIPITKGMVLIIEDRCKGCGYCIAFLPSRCPSRVQAVQCQRLPSAGSEERGGLRELPLLRNHLPGPGHFFRGNSGALRGRGSPRGDRLGGLVKGVEVCP